MANTQYKVTFELVEPVTPTVLEELIQEQFPDAQNVEIEPLE